MLVVKSRVRRETKPRALVIVGLLGVFKGHVDCCEVFQLGQHQESLYRGSAHALDLYFFFGLLMWLIGKYPFKLSPTLLLDSLQTGWFPNAGRKGDVSLCPFVVFSKVLYNMEAKCTCLILSVCLFACFGFFCHFFVRLFCFLCLFSFCRLMSNKE